MFYLVKRSETLVLPPHDINPSIRFNITNQLKSKFEGQVAPEHGLTLAITQIEDIRANGIIDVNDGSVHFLVNFESFVINPKVNDVFPGTVTGITDRSFLIVSCGPLSCLVHPDQILQGTYTFEPESSQFVHQYGTSPSISQGTTVWVQVSSDNFNANNTIIGSIVKVCTNTIQHNMGE